MHLMGIVLTKILGAPSYHREGHINHAAFFRMQDIDDEASALPYQFLPSTGRHLGYQPPITAPGPEVKKTLQSDEKPNAPDLKKHSESDQICKEPPVTMEPVETLAKSSSQTPSNNLRPTTSLLRNEIPSILVQDVDHPAVTGTWDSTNGWLKGDRVIEMNSSAKRDIAAAKTHSIISPDGKQLPDSSLIPSAESGKGKHPAGDQLNEAKSATPTETAKIKPSALAESDKNKLSTLPTAIKREAAVSPQTSTWQQKIQGQDYVPPHKRPPVNQTEVEGEVGTAVTSASPKATDDEVTKPHQLTSHQKEVTEQVQNHLPPHLRIPVKLSVATAEVLRDRLDTSSTATIKSAAQVASPAPMSPNPQPKIPSESKASLAVAAVQSSQKPGPTNVQPSPPSINTPQAHPSKQSTQVANLPKNTPQPAHWLTGSSQTAGPSKEPTQAAGPSKQPTQVASHSQGTPKLARWFSETPQTAGPSKEASAAAGPSKPASYASEWMKEVLLRGLGSSQQQEKQMAATPGKVHTVGSDPSISSDLSVRGENDSVPDAHSSIVPSISLDEHFKGENPSVDSEIVFEGRQQQVREADRPVQIGRGNDAVAVPYESNQLAGWDGNWQPAPVEWNRRDQYDPKKPEHRAKIIEFIKQSRRLLQESEGPLNVENDPDWRSGGSLALGLRKFAPAIHPGHHVANHAEDPFTLAKIHQNAQQSAENYVRRAPPKTHDQQQEERKGDIKADKQAYRQWMKENRAALGPNPYKPKLKIYIRPAERTDMGQVCEIYNHYILNSTVVAEIKPMNERQWQARLEGAEDERYAFLVAISSPYKFTMKDVRRRQVVDEKVVGFIYAEEYGASDGMWRYVCELSVFVDHRYLHLGIAKNLMDVYMFSLDPCHSQRGGCRFYGGENYLRYEAGGIRCVCHILINFCHRPDDKTQLAWLKEWLDKEFEFEVISTLPEIGNKLGGP